MDSKQVLQQSHPLLIALIDNLMELGKKHKCALFIEYAPEVKTGDEPECWSTEWYSKYFDKDGDFIIHGKPILDKDGNLISLPWHKSALTMALEIYAVCAGVRKACMNDYLTCKKKPFVDDLNLVLKKLSFDHVEVFDSRRGIIFVNKLLSNKIGLIKEINSSGDDREILGYILDYCAVYNDKPEDACYWQIFLEIKIDGVWKEICLHSEFIAEEDIDKKSKRKIKNLYKRYADLYRNIGSVSRNF